MFIETKTQNCLHRRLNNGIYEFAFLNNSRVAVDDFLAIVDPYISAMDRGQFPDSVMPMLIELHEAGMPSMAYLSAQYRDLLTRHPGPFAEVRLVYVYKSGFMPSIARAFLTLLPERNTVHRRFFHVSSRPEAEAWLLEGIAESVQDTNKKG